MKAPPLAYVRAGSVDHAVAVLAEHGDEAKLLAGGQSLMPMLNLRLARPSVLVDIGGLEGLAGVDADGEAVLVGALTTHHDMTRPAPTGSSGLRAMSDAARLIGHHPVRIRGTVGGSLAHGDATAEWALLALAMDAALLVRGPSGDREISADDFFLGIFTTALAPDEMITAIRFGRATAHTRLEEHSRRHGDFALVAAAASVAVENGLCTSARIALGGVAGMPVRVEPAERVLAGAAIDDRAALQEIVREAASTCAREIAPRSDNHGSAQYRRRLTEALVGRSLRRSLATAATAAT